VTVLKKSGAVRLARSPFGGRQASKRAAVAYEVGLVTETGSGGNRGPSSNTVGVEPKHRAKTSEAAVADGRQADARQEPSLESALTETEIPC